MMIFSDQRIELRQLFFDIWNKHHTKVILQPLEQQILQVILDHPEYHFILSDPDNYLDKDFSPEAGETNPFLHMSLHLGIREQISTNRPQGITIIFNKLLARYQGDVLEVEHVMLNVLAELIWESQHNHVMPDESKYLERLQGL